MLTNETSHDHDRRVSARRSPPLKRTVGYIRVSTEKQADGYGLEAQEKAIQVYAKTHNLGPITIYREAGVSGTLEDRPALGRLLYDIKEQKDIGTVLIVRLDRLARDVVLQETIIRDLTKRGVLLVSTTEPDLGSSEPSRILYREIMGAFSGYERRMIKMRLAAGRRAKAEAGGYPAGKRPFGYKRTMGFNGKDRPDIAVDTDTMERVKLIFRLKRRKWSLRRIANHLNDQGVPTSSGGKMWYPATVSYILRNPIYKGKISYNGVSTNRIELSMKQKPYRPVKGSIQAQMA